ncbi:MAG: uracil-DNA glycosylase [Nanoarchaeota archaeon]|nr:uracil-DNA glycosylase [Nanoarchaeota archaeon]MBU1644178.1 uracil-DNA glycosylase [Nanoarchaeota archaeon]MBU1977517.1 uracil-DNA glycosylase [Nanoarchaeota archaeon]
MSTLFSLAEEIRRCTSCPLWKKRTLAVPGDGNSKTKIMFVGEAPGVEEDRQGLPFVGKSGKFLNEMLNLVDLNRKDLFITGAVKCRPENNRVPSAKELQTCKELWLDKQIGLIKPELIVILGNSALKSLLKKTKLSELHGKIIMGNNQKYFVTYHPAAGMRFPKIKEEMKKDFLKLKSFVNLLY